MIRVCSLLLVASIGLAACSTTESLESAERKCAREASLADGIGGSIRGGVSTDGPTGGISLTITDNIFAPKDEIAVYENCVYKRTGKSPSRTLGMVR